MTTDPVVPTPRRRRTVSVAIGLLLVVAATLGVPAGPASADPPGNPVGIGAVSFSSGIRLYIAPPSDDGGRPVTLYTAYRVPTGNVMVPPATFTAPDTRVIIDTTAVPGVSYDYVVRVVNADGQSFNSEKIVATRPAATKDDFTKFGGSKGAFVVRQYKDFFGRAATDTELLAGQSTLTSAPDAGPYLASLATDARRASRLAVVRLYFAYFKRGPDHGGLAYWTAQLAAKKKDLDDVSNSFARSTEFKRTYGSLSNADFVTLVYKNVLGRTPEPTGFAFWKGQLDKKLVVRGRVMTQFSESSEYKTASRGLVQASDAWDAMIGTNIPVDVLSAMADHIMGGGNIGDVAQFFIDSAAYKVP